MICDVPLEVWSRWKQSGVGDSVILSHSYVGLGVLQMETMRSLWNNTTKLTVFTGSHRSHDVQKLLSLPHFYLPSTLTCLHLSHFSSEAGSGTKTIFQNRSSPIFPVLPVLTELSVRVDGYQRLEFTDLKKAFPDSVWSQLTSMSFNFSYFQNSHLFWSPWPVDFFPPALSVLEMNLNSLYTISDPSVVLKHLRHLVCLKLTFARTDDIPPLVFHELAQHSLKLQSLSLELDRVSHSESIFYCLHPFLNLKEVALRFKWFNSDSFGLPEDLFALSFMSRFPVPAVSITFGESESSRYQRSALVQFWKSIGIKVYG